MSPDEARERYKRINRQVLRHRTWNAAVSTPYGGPWVQGVVERLVALAGDEEVEYVESRGDITLPEDGSGVKVALTAFTASRRLHVWGAYRPGPEGSEAEVFAKSRAGLARVEALSLLEWGSSDWPPGLKLRLVYSDGDEFVLGDYGGDDVDQDAPARLAEFYPGLLADLAPVRA